MTARAAGLFIWAETVTRVLKQGLPEEQLRLILDGDLGNGDNLSTFYGQIPDISFWDVKGRTLDVVGLTISPIVLAKAPFYSDELHLFVSEPKSSVKFVLDKLSSAISIGTTDGRIRIGHLSFIGFLSCPNRCPQTLFVDREKEGHQVTMTCFRGLKFNICNLETSDISNDQVKNLSKRMEKNIPGPMLYSC